MSLQPGEIIDGKYRIVRMVGEGGMGAVYEGENTRIKRRVAIKVLHSAVAEKKDVVRRFEREAQAAGHIGSEHIVEVLDLGNLPSGERFMVMEFLDGEDLTSRIKSRKRLTPHEAIPILHQVLEGLAAAHEASIIHRDLKPDNIYILKSKAGRADFVKILDFGVSKFNALDSEMSMTRTGAVMGTPYYMSPEQAKGGTVDNRSDLYAMGVVLYQMVTGRVPFNASSFNELLFKIALESPEPIETIVPNCPPSFINLVNKAMSRDANARFQSAREFQQALMQWQQITPQPGGDRTAPLPQVPDMRAQQGSAPMLHAGSTGPFAQSAPGPATPMHNTSPGIGPSGPSGAGSGFTEPHSPGLMQSSPQQFAGTPVPGIDPALGVSHSPLAVTALPKKKNSGLVAALVLIGVVVCGGGVVGAYVLTQSPEAPATQPPAESQPESQAPAETQPAETQPAETQPAETTAETSAETTAEPDDTADTDDSATPVETTPPAQPKPASPTPKPLTQPKPTPTPKPQTTPKPKPKAKPKPKPGRTIHETL